MSSDNLFFDFEYEVRTNPFYFDKVNKALTNLDKAYKYTLKHNAGYNEHREALVDYLRVSKFNITPLLGFYFPKYPLGTPFSLQDFPFAHAYYNLNIGPGCFTILRGSRQISKSLNFNNLCKFRNKKTGEIIEMTIGDFYNLHNKHKFVEDTQGT